MGGGSIVPALVWTMVMTTLLIGAAMLLWAVWALVIDAVTGSRASFT